MYAEGAEVRALFFDRAGDFQTIALEDDAEVAVWSTPLPVGHRRRLGRCWTPAVLGGLLFSTAVSIGWRGLMRLRRSGDADRTFTANWEVPTNAHREIDVAVVSQAPLLDFYIYRAYAGATMDLDASEHFTFGDINARTMDGIMSFLKHEVVMTYANETRCPRNHNISRIKRFRIRTRATKELFAENMNMGSLFTYQGKCLGRCFPDGFCTGHRDCDFHYEKYGFIPGCNSSTRRFHFPLEGRCKFPTGDHDCTWSFEDAGEVTLELLEATSPAEGHHGNCCAGKCTNFWDIPNDVRTEAAMDMFGMMYPEQPRHLDTPKCDFQWEKWYAKDPWQELSVETEKPMRNDQRSAQVTTSTDITTMNPTTTTTTAPFQTSAVPATLVNNLAIFDTTTVPAVVSQAPLQEFYIYRATMPEATTKYPFGNINAGNLDGVMWYLQNEVVTMYTNGTRCPRKFNISTIKRFKFRYRPTNELYRTNLSYGARFSFDLGKCVGRCFADNMCTLGDDCKQHYDKYGYIVGCNNFRDKYPFPDVDTPAPGGIWYSLPLDGRCAYPTGAHDCTWSYEEAGEIPLALLEASFPGSGQCCNGVCTDFWDDIFSDERTIWRREQTLDLFKMMYPEMPRQLSVPPCDFTYTKWYYPKDRWEKVDPWAKDGYMYK